MGFKGDTVEPCGLSGKDSEWCRFGGRKGIGFACVQQEALGGSHIYKSEVRRGLGPEMEMEVTSVIGGSWGWMQLLQAWLSVETWSPAWWGHLPGNQWACGMLHRGKLSPEVE